MDKIDMEKLQNLPVLGATNLVRVSMPAEAYFNLDKFQRVQKDILGRLGCPACTSGYDIRYTLHRRFLVDEKLNVNPIALPQDPIPI